MEVTSLGDSALIVRISDRFDGAQTLRAVMAAHRCLLAAQLPGLLDIAPAYTTVALFFDPMVAVESGAPIDGIIEWYEHRIFQTLANADEIHTAPIKARTIRVPVCYDPEFGFDLDDVARNAGLSGDEVVELHSGADYLVHCVGFTPGFPFLGGLPKEIATPRRSTPRKEIPAGSVGIGGEQTGIYPVKSPGGWNIIGRTPLRLFDPAQNPPARLRPGDRVQFQPITRKEFDTQTKR